ncbi:MAG: LysM peptidoglycan-binding domain-containing protein [Chloroflexi bacterium]|nr:LysM peptidoglycan-binding domain-containing protein [Chloroflexota bacterium]
MKKIHFIVLTIFLLLVVNLQAREQVLASPQNQITSAGQLIDAVNGLRLSYGLPALTSHPILMQTAQSQADYMAATGQVTHTRPGGITYTQQLLSLGFPLAGDLSLGGFRAENILMSSNPLVWDGVPPAWQDDLHMNTMLSQNYTNIGAGISQGGNGYYYAVDTAATTSDGQMQTNALQNGGSGEAAGVSQYMVPVAKSTARADGDVIHAVQYGQSLWSIAIEYGTTIKNIQALNNLGEDLVVFQGQELLVLKGATPPPLDIPTPELTTPLPLLLPTIPTLTSTAISFTPALNLTATPLTEEPRSSDTSSALLFSVLIIAACVIGGMAVWLIRDPD